MSSSPPAYAGGPGPTHIGAMLAVLLAISLVLCLLGLCVGSQGLDLGELAHPQRGWPDGLHTQIMVDIRLPRTLGAWLAGALLGLAGGCAQGLLRNPLAEPYLLGSSAGAALGVALCLVAFGASPSAANWVMHLGLTTAAFIGACGATALTLALSQGSTHTTRLLLCGVVIGAMGMAATQGLSLLVPDILRPLQVFVLGSTAWLDWHAAGLMAACLALTLSCALACARVLDALSLGDAVATSLGLPVSQMRLCLIAAMSLATAAAVAQCGLISFVGLVAPHLVRNRYHGKHAAGLVLCAAMGGCLLLGADLLSRWLIAPQELPVGIFTAVLGGGYLLWLLRQRDALQAPARRPT